jgi:hypothetical protein
MSDVAKLARALTLIDQAALSAILEPQSQERREALCALILEHRPLVVEDFQRDDADAWRKKLLGVTKDVLATSAALGNGSERKRLGLSISYIRTMRGFIAKVLPSLR